ncbi:MAG: ABC transporter substrate-binding protein [Clostridia bacterium]|nr:ABC transporter substrate-binding protein [Clostridia bacterium]
MKKITKIAALALAAVMSIGLSSCSKGNSDEIPTLKWYMFGETPQDLASVMEAANEILVPKIGAKLNMVYIDDAAYSERMKMNMASGDDYDLCFIGYNNPYVNAVTNGGLYPISEYLEDCPALTESLPDFILECGKYQGETYAVANYQIAATVPAIYIYKDLADEYGLKADEVKELRDLEPFYDWLKEKHPEVYPFRTGGGGGIGDTETEDVSISNGVVWDHETGKVEFAFDRDNTQAEALLMREWYEKGYIRQDISLVTDQTSDEKAGKYASWRAIWKPGAEAEYEAVRGRPVICIKLGTGKIQAKSLRDTMIGVGANTKHPELAVKFIEQMNTNKDLYNLIAFGIEGKHYDLNEEGKVVYRENSGYEPGNTWRFGNQFNALLLEGQEDGIWEETIAFNESSETDALFGFTFSNEKVKTEVSQISQVIQKHPSLKTGAEPVEAYWDSMIQEIKNAGVDKVIAEAQAQVDEFLATK